MKHLAIILAVIAFAHIGCDRGAATPTTAPSPTTTPAAAPTVGTVQWVDPKSIQEGPIQHDTLSSEQMDRIKKIHDAFAEVDPEPIEKWVDDFKRDLDIEQEMSIWERMVKAYQPFIASHNLSIAARKEAFQVILMRSMASEDDTLAHLSLKVLSREDAVDLMRRY